MSTGLTESGAHDMLSGIRTTITHVQAYDGDPASGGVAKGARQPYTFPAPVAAGLLAQADVDIPLADGDGADHLAFFTAATGGVLKHRIQVPRQTFTGAAWTFRIDSARIRIPAAEGIV